MKAVAAIQNVIRDSGSWKLSVSYYMEDGNGNSLLVVFNPFSDNPLDGLNAIRTAVKSDASSNYSQTLADADVRILDSGFLG